MVSRHKSGWRELRIRKKVVGSSILVWEWCVQLHWGWVSLYFVDQITLTSYGVENLSLIVVVQLQISSVSLREPGIFCHFPVGHAVTTSFTTENMDSSLSSWERFLFPLIMGFLLVLGCSGSVSAPVDM